jgi:nicotinic acid mononucleotide adenylyltransferase
MLSVVSNLINDGYKATIIECGHGALVANEFLSTPGASQLVVYGKQPYSKDIQHFDYPSTEDYRSVSQEFVYHIMRAELTRNHIQYGDKTITFVSSFQLSDGGKLCHGYFGIGQYIGDEPHFTIYHLSFYKKHNSKQLWITQIKNHLMDIIERHFYQPSKTIGVVDAIWESYRTKTNTIEMVQNIEATLIINNDADVAENDNFLCFTPNNEMVRFEDIIRLNKGKTRGLIMQKGSFNPFHRMHRNIAENAKKHHPDYPHVLVLSAVTCDKGINGPAVLEERIKKLTALGYYVMVTKSGYFIHNLDWMRYYYDDLNVVFPVGEDTIERFLRDWEEYYAGYPREDTLSEYKHKFQNVEWFITNRSSDTKHFGSLIPEYGEWLNNFTYSDLPMDDISSTKIRNGEIENEI